MEQSLEMKRPIAFLARIVITSATSYTVTAIPFSLLFEKQKTDGDKSFSCGFFAVKNPVVKK